MTNRPRRAIAWFRRDLRLADNRMLEAATAAADRVWPVFVVDPEQVHAHAAAPGRVAWYAANVSELDARLAATGSGLTVRCGMPDVVLRDLAAELDADVVFAAEDEDPTARARDERVRKLVDLVGVEDQRIVSPGDLMTRDGGSYVVFTPFRRALEARLAADPDGLTADASPSVERLAPPRRSDAFEPPEPPHRLPAAGELAAIDRLEGFVSARARGYREERDRPGLESTSRLSPYLRVGAISIRACWRAALAAAERARERGDRDLARGVDAWRAELAWREFFAHVVAARPRLARESFRREYDSVEWTDGTQADELLAAWHEGRTGFPMVDAGMRQLIATGWMHNRARLITASFLVKDAGIDWRRGESVFLEHLLDADVQQNNGNWQWVAGVGTDAAPYFRVFNPTLQARKFDPDGTFIRRWVPELSDVPSGNIHEPWRASSRSPSAYPSPILNHADARQRALARYAAVDTKRRVASAGIRP